VDLSNLGNDIERVVVSEEQIQTRLKELAKQVEKDYEGKDLVLVGVLKGAVMAMADFSRHLQRHIDMD
jgi:hypoxanthine phosphoribosyltransferase